MTADFPTFDAFWEEVQKAWTAQWATVFGANWDGALGESWTGRWQMGHAVAACSNGIWDCFAGGTSAEQLQNG